MSSFFQRLARLFSSSGSQSAGHSYWYTVQCNRCGEQIRGRVDLRNDLSPTYGEGDIPSGMYFCRKVLVGENRCYQPVEVELTFDQNHKVVDRQIHNGKFVDEA